MTIHDLDHAQEPKGRQRAEQRRSSCLDPSPAQQIALNGRYIVGGSSMTHLVHIEPFVVVIEKMEGAAGEFLIPEIIESDRNSRSQGRFCKNHPIHPAGIILFRIPEKFLR